jgi:hypothetical protein
VEPAPVDSGPRADDEARVVHAYDEAAGGWREYPYPEEIASFTGAQSYGEGTLLQSTMLGQGLYGTDPDPAGTWLLDLQTGTFSRPALICGEVPALPGEGRWIVFSEEANPAQPYLCNIETGERTGPLPVEGVGDFFESGGDAPVSPDGQWAILFGRSSVYSYHFSSGDLLALGQLGFRNWQQAHWLDATRAILSTGTSRPAIPGITIS